VLLALVGLFTFFALIDELDSLSAKFSLLNLFYLQALAIPTRVYDLLPIGLLIGAILALAGLAQRNELVILRVSGVSGLKLLVMLWAITVPLVLGAFFLSEIVTPVAEIKSSEANLVMLGRTNGASLNSGYWFKESRPENGGTRIINIQKLEANGGVSGIVVYEFDPHFQLARYSQAASGRFGNGKLILDHVTENDIDSNAVSALAGAKQPTSPITHVDTVAQRVLSTTLTPDRLIARILTPDRMSISDLLDYIGYLKANHLQTDRQVVALWRKVAYPFTLLVMITIAAPIGFMQTRRGGVGSKVFLGIITGVGFFMLNQLALNMGMLSKWPPWITAIVPNVAVLLLALGALMLMENQHHVRAFRQRAWARKPA
jgi:lipopolysaccharide export system permease protein